MRFLVGPAWTCLEGRWPPESLDLLQRTLRYRQPGYFFSPQHRYRGWDGWVTLFDTSVRPPRFPSGLTARAQRALADEEWDVELEHQDAIISADPHVSDSLPDGTVLYPDQVSAVELAVERKRGLWACAPNFGKTECAAALFAAYCREPGLLIVDGKELLRQTHERLEARLREKIGWLGAGRRTGLDRRVVVATIQSLRQRREAAALLQRAQVLVVDEAHVVTKLWLDTLARCPAPVRIGMSGTVREAAVPLLMEAHLGPVLIEVKDFALVSEGRSAQPHIFMPYAGAIIRPGEYRDEYHQGIALDYRRNQMIVEAVVLLARCKLRSLVLFYLLEHGELLRTLLQRAGVRAALVHGGTHPREVEEARLDLTERRSDAIVASTVWNKGLDLPALEAIVNAAAWKSSLATRQKLGRGLRRKLEGANRVILVDPWDLGSDLRKRHSQAREATYRRAGFPVQVGEWAALAGPLEEAAHGVDAFPRG